MLRNTFMHIPRIGQITERYLWEAGILCWDDFFEKTTFRQSPERKDFMKNQLEESRLHYQNNNPYYFAGLLPSNQLWRLFPKFRDSVAYLDIETTGLESWNNEITTIALYDGKTIFTYVNGQNLNHFKKNIMKYQVVITYNGKCFDIPFIKSCLGISLNQVHIDLRYILASLGFRGGLKGCERQLEINRNELSGIDGYFAVLLWHDYIQNNNQKALDTLLAYNIQDVVNLETLMVISYNLNLKKTLFHRSHQLSLPAQPDIPFRADKKTVERIKVEFYSGTEPYYYK